MLRLGKIPIFTAALWVLTVMVAFLAGASLAWRALEKPSAEAMDADTQTGLELADPGPGETVEGDLKVSDHRNAGEKPAREDLESDAPHDLVSRFTVAVNETDPVKRVIGMAEALEGLNASNVQEAVAIFEDLPPGRGRALELNLLMHAWGSIDGPSAIDYAQNKIRGGASRFATYTAISSWAAADPEAALAWSTERTEGTSNRYLPGVVAGWANYHLADASQFVAELPEGRERNWSVEVLTSNYLQLGGGEAVDWAADLREGRFKELVQTSVARQWARQEPAASAEWVEALAEFDQVGDAVRIVSSEWARSDPQTAIEWAAQLSDAEVRTEGIVAVIDRWAADDPNAAGEWLNEKPLDASLDPAIDAFSRRIARMDPESALSWAESIVDSEVRAKSLIEVGQNWYRDDPEGAARWIENSGLPSELRDSMANPPPRRRDDRRSRFFSRGPGF